jgi:hypothetical protein
LRRVLEKRPPFGGDSMAKGQMRSNREKKKPKQDKKKIAAAPSMASSIGQQRKPDRGGSKKGS